MSDYRDLSPYFTRHPGAYLWGSLLALFDATVIALRMISILNWLANHLPANAKEAA